MTTTNLDSFFKDDESQWLDALPNYQKDVVSELLAFNSNDYDKAALSWLEASVDNTSPFSGEPKKDKKYFESLKNEVYKLLCGNPDYSADRDELTQLVKSEGSKSSVIAFISGIIGAKLGLAAAFVSPAIVILFMMITKTSLNAWCAMK
ncbi:hypothetical protein [Priestia megaterium]|uniref:hypothetical protein n=1 Tax=Priestia megaterium TaxID=1404 RepID=UPI001FB2896E|nr:hypothetical protein [Priestia megaterium]